MKTQEQPRQDWTVVLRRRPVRMVGGRPEGGWTDEYEIVCCECEMTRTGTGATLPNPVVRTCASRRSTRLMTSNDTQRSREGPLLCVSRESPSSLAMTIQYRAGNTTWRRPHCG